jgi:chromosome segregation ATPase
MKQDKENGMSTRFQLTIDSTKQSEIKALRKLAEKVGPDSYIGSLLTEDFLNWAEKRMREDWTLDLFELTNHWENESRERGQEIVALTNELAESRRATDSVKTLFRSEQDSWLAEREGWEDSVKASQQRSTALAEQLREAEDRAVEAEDQVEALELELVRLKARLFDQSEAE